MKVSVILPIFATGWMCLIGVEVYAASAEVKTITPPTSVKSSYCPSTDFNDFFEKYSENTELQKTFLRLPLKSLTIDNSGTEPKYIVNSLKSEQISIPVIPSKNERLQKNINVLVDRLDDSTAEISVRSRTETRKNISLFFEKKSCWQLTKLEDWTFPESYKSSWLINIFHRMKACTPTNLFFDKNKKASIGNFFESKGYKNPKLTEQLATYSVNEKFFGFDATEVSIPAADVSIYSITVRASPKQLVTKIKSLTGLTVPVLKDAPVKSAEAYIARKDDVFSFFICSTFEE